VAQGTRALAINIVAMHEVPPPAGAVGRAGIYNVIVSSPENPFEGASPPLSSDPQQLSGEAGLQAVRPQPILQDAADAGFVEPRSIDSPVVISPSPGFPSADLPAMALPTEQKFPPWGFGALAMVIAVWFFALTISVTVAAVIAASFPTFSHATFTEISQSPVVVIGAEVGAYLITLLFLYRLLLVRYRMGFLDGLRWHWPASRWPRFLAVGVALAVAMQIASSRLPIPKNLPIDTYYTSTAAAWAMAFLGVLIAPFVEEVFFRGLLFPVLERRMGLFAGVVLTSLAFAALHGTQLGWAWGPLSVILAVGLVLTIVRARTNSVACSVLVHTAYNATPFALMLAQTNLFRHMERLK